MDSNRLAVERATWVVLLKQDLKDHGYGAREHVNDYQTIFIVTHKETPIWWIKLTVCSAHRSRNRVEIDAKVFSYSCNAMMRAKLMDALKESRRGFDSTANTLKEQEAAAKAWDARQEQELSGIAELKGVDAQIIRSGPYAGEYRVTMHPGNPLEHLTLEQFKALHKLLSQSV